MKKAFLAFLVLFSFSLSLYAQAESVAKEVLTAYKNKDAELLRKNASGIMKMAISPSFFSDPSVKENMKSVENWNGKIKEIRYGSENMMGQKIMLACAYYADVPGKDEMYVVFLSSTDNKTWVMFANGIDTINKTEFEALNKGLSTAEAKPARIFNIEMANGDVFEKVSMEKMISCFDKLDDDNFFVIMSCGDDFIQAAVSDDGFYLEYNENGIQYASSGVIPKNQTIDLFKKYYDGDADWNKNVNWEKY